MGPAMVAARPVFRRVEGHLPRVVTAPPDAMPAPPGPVSEGWARAWAGDVDGAEAALPTGPDEASSATLVGAIAVLRRQPARALVSLDRAIAAGAGEEARLFRVRALLQAGRVDDAAANLAALGDGESFARRVLVALVGALRGPAGAEFDAWATSVARSEVHLNGMFATQLPAILGSEAVTLGLRSRSALVAMLEGVVDRMAGHLGASPTFAETRPDGTRAFVHVPLPASSREQAVAALGAVRTAGPDIAATSLDALVAAHPRSVHALCYRGELDLWRGRYAAALADFRRARRIEPARWADIGAVAVLTLTGRLGRARAMARTAERRSTPIRAGTLPVYRGVLARRLGDLEAAIVDLSGAVDAKPTRVGARLELCLALRAAGRGGEAAEHAGVLVRDAAPLLVDGATSLGLPWMTAPEHLVGNAALEAALRAMRGNRSSMVTTWFAPDGAMRALDARTEIMADARRVLGGD